MAPERRRRRRGDAPAPRPAQRAPARGHRPRAAVPADRARRVPEGLQAAARGRARDAASASRARSSAMRWRASRTRATCARNADRATSWCAARRPGSTRIRRSARSPTSCARTNSASRSRRRRRRWPPSAAMPRDLADLARTLDRAATALDNGVHHLLADLNFDFHRAVARATHNPFYLKTVEMIPNFIGAERLDVTTFGARRPAASAHGASTPSTWPSSRRSASATRCAPCATWSAHRRRARLRARAAGVQRHRAHAASTATASVASTAPDCIIDSHRRRNDCKSTRRPERPGRGRRRAWRRPVRARSARAADRMTLIGHAVHKAAATTGPAATSPRRGARSRASSSSG